MSQLENKPHMKSKGSKEEVFNGLALKTSGGLSKEQLVENSKGKIVSKAKHDLGKKAFGHLHKKAEAEPAEIKEEIAAISEPEEIEAAQENADDDENNLQKKEAEEEKNCYADNENSLNQNELLHSDAVEEFKSDEAEKQLEDDCKLPIEESILNDVMKDAPVNASAYPMIAQPKIRKPRAPRKPISKK